MVAEKAEIKQADIIDELRKLAFSNVLDYMKPDDNGGLIVDLSNLKRSQAAAITEITVEQTMEAQPYVDATETPAKPGMVKIKLKLADKRAALIDLGKHLGMFNDRVEIDVTVGLYAMTDAELETHARQIAKRMGITLPDNLLVPKRRLLN